VWFNTVISGRNGDGKTDDINAIAATHGFANQNGPLVKAEQGASYYTNGKEHIAII
jgi:predicted ATPase